MMTSAESDVEAVPAGMPNRSRNDDGAMASGFGCESAFRNLIETDWNAGMDSEDGWMEILHTASPRVMMLLYPAIVPAFCMTIFPRN
jgi:hypothetical protein